MSIKYRRFATFQVPRYCFAMTLTVAIAGLGAIGKVLAGRLLTDPSETPQPRALALSAVAARDAARARDFLARHGADHVPVLPLAALAGAADVVVEALPAAVFDDLAEPTLRQGKTLVVISVGTLLSRPALFSLAAQHGGRLVVPTGALIGLDAVQAAAQGTVHSVRMLTRKPPAGLRGAPHLQRAGINLEGLSEPLRVFAGSAREAVIGFPANVNVVAALSLAGIGPERTQIEIWADPGVDRNHHRIEVESDSARFSMEIANIPSEDNPRTGKITALSVLATLRKLASPVVIGT